MSIEKILEKSVFRFAPSPTGFLHLGGARTALFNFLAAKGTENGKYYVRIEDTDTARSKKEFEESILKDLQWLGLAWDGEIVRQSDRIEHYKEKAAELVQKGLAYPCYCESEKLEENRKKALSQGMTPRYPGTCGNLSQAERESLERQGKKPAIRFRIPEDKTQEIQMNDLIKGSVSISLDELEDFTILRSNGIPTYHLSVVVDDHDFGITHILRGDDHLSNTPKHILLYRAFDWTIPHFGHLPTMLGKDGKRLSKRNGSDSIGNLKKEGFLPEAVTNYLSLVGWSPGNDLEFFLLNDLKKIFSLQRVQKSAGIFDPQKLRHFNGQHLRSLEKETFIKKLQEFLPENLTEELGDRFPDAAMAIQERIEVFNDAICLLEKFTLKSVAYSVDALAQLQTIPLQNFLNLLNLFFEKNKDVRKDGIIKELANEAKDLEMKGKRFYMSLRAVLTGEVHGPDLVHLIPALGQEIILGRLSNAAFDLLQTGQRI